MYDTFQVSISIIILNITFSYVGPQNMMDGVFVSIESIYLA